MKKYILPFLAIAFLMIAPIAFGQEPFPIGEIPAATEVGSIWDILINALNWFFNIVIILAAIMIVYAGFRYVTAAGNPDATKAAMNTLVYALIGVAIALLAKGLIYIVSQFIIGAGISF